MSWCVCKQVSFKRQRACQRKQFANLKTQTLKKRKYRQTEAERDKQMVKWAQIKPDRCDGVVGVGGGSEVKTKKVENKKQKKKMPSEEGLVAGQSA